MTKPKPCPFCGGEARTIWHPPKIKGGLGENFGHALVECIKCGAVPWSVMGYDGEETKECVIERWNRRTNDNS